MPRLREVRDAKGFSRAHLAALSGMSMSTIILLENGTTYDPKVYTVQRLADALGVKFSDLYDPAYVQARYAAVVEN
jgi:transcriptional regulator with XRE-family HTH domain